MVARKKSCESCGMPMQKADEFGGNDVNNRFCVYCTDQTGKLKSRKEVRKGMVQFYQSHLKKTKKEAEEFVDKQMMKFPAWRGK
jgi:hypothetical protein